MNQQAIREAFENAVDTYHIYGEDSLHSYCRSLHGQLTPIEDSLILAYGHNCGSVGNKNRAWDALINEFTITCLETLAIRYFDYEPLNNN